MILFLLAVLLGSGQDPKPAPPGWTVRVEPLQKRYRPTSPALLRFTIENVSDKSAAVPELKDYLEGLEVTAPDRRVLKTYGRTKEFDRTVRLEPGGFFGRTIDAAKLFDACDGVDGIFQLRWKVDEAESEPIEILLVGNYVATLETSLGEIQVEFFPEEAPNHVLQFLKRAREGFYDGTKFHRIIPGFMMQGGRPKDPAQEPQETLKAEFGRRAHVAGTLSMARTPDPDSAKTEFFLCFAPCPFLDGKYTVFGQMVSGADTLSAIENVKTDHNPCSGCGQEHPRKATPQCGAPGHHVDAPTEEVLLRRVTLKKKEEAR